MTDLAPPSAKLVRNTVYNKDWWVCYYCEIFFVSADFKLLQEREVWKCRRCGRIQALGRGVIPFADEPVAQLARAPEANIGRWIPSRSANEPAMLPLPENMDPNKLATIQREYDELKKLNPRKEPAQKKVAELIGISRTTVREYWPFLRKQQTGL